MIKKVTEISRSFTLTTPLSEKRAPFACFSVPFFAKFKF